MLSLELYYTYKVQSDSNKKYRNLYIKSVES